MSKVYVALTGGGSRFVSNILCAGGASAYFEGATIPYGKEQLMAFLCSEDCSSSFLTSCDLADGKLKFASEEVAGQLALVSALKAQRDREGESWGIGCSGCLGYEGQRDGRENFAFIGVVKYAEGNPIDAEVWTFKIKLNSKTSRQAQEDLIALKLQQTLEIILKHEEFSEEDCITLAE